jgi:glycosyltransferase involved in cell wall biosynthesis
LLHGELTDEEVNGLYNHPKVKAMISFTHGEGFGRPLLEFGTTGKPIIAPNWSGQTDFLGNYTTKLPGQLYEVHPSAQQEGILIKGSQWFYVDYGYAAKVLKDVYKKYKTFIATSRKQRKYVKDNFSLAAMDEELARLCSENIPEPVKLKLPKLKLPSFAATQGDK